MPNNLTDVTDNNVGKMTNNEIKKALECCATSGDFTKSQIEICSPCPYVSCGDCTGLLKANTLNLIKRQDEEINRLQAENEKFKKAKYIFANVDYCADDLDKALEENDRLKAENERLKNAYKQCAWERDTFQEELKTAQAENERLTHITRNLVGEIKAEAMTEFVKELEETFGYYDWENKVMVYPEEEIDNLLKEMVGEDK